MPSVMRWPTTRKATRWTRCLCAVQAAWAATQPGYGLPADLDPLEGWIVSA